VLVTRDDHVLMIWPAFAPESAPKITLVPWPASEPTGGPESGQTVPDQILFRFYGLRLSIRPAFVQIFPVCVEFLPGQNMVIICPFFVPAESGRVV
jgi:hypothetical protein